MMRKHKFKIALLSSDRFCLKDSPANSITMVVTDFETSYPHKESAGQICCETREKRTCA